MKPFTLLSLGLIAFCGCGDTITDTAMDDRVEPEQYEVSKPIIDGSPAPTHDPSMVDPMDDTTTAPAPSGSADINANVAESSDLNGAAAPSPQGTVDTDIQTPANDSAPLEEPASTDLAGGIRTQIDDANLSDAAKEIEITSEAGKVNLSGKVKDQAEKDRIEEIAIRLAGEGNVNNNLEVE